MNDVIPIDPADNEPAEAVAETADSANPPPPSAPPRGTGAMGPRHADELDAPHQRSLREAANRAASTGRRFDLARYLRLRRGAHAA